VKDRFNRLSSKGGQEPEIDSSDDELLETIKSYPSVRDYALSVLGITEDDLQEFLDYKDISKREKVEAIVSSSSPSFGRYMSEQFLAYESFKQTVKLDWKRLGKDYALRNLRRIANKQQHNLSDVADMNTYLYYMWRFLGD
jgi:hypothetical protein